MSINEFWEHARVAANLNPFAEWIGPRVRGTVPPPAWAFGDSPELSDELAAAVVSGRKTGTASLAWEYDDGEHLPEKGDLSIVLDGAGQPRALIITTDVQRVRFDEVDEDHALTEADSLDDWRADHQAFASRRDNGSHPFRLGMEMILERFELLYPKH